MSNVYLKLIVTSPRHYVNYKGNATQTMQVWVALKFGEASVMEDLRVLELANLERSPRVCIFHKFPGEADGAGLGIMKIKPLT